MPPPNDKNTFRVSVWGGGPIVLLQKGPFKPLARVLNLKGLENIEGLIA